MYCGGPRRGGDAWGVDRGALGGHVVFCLDAIKHPGLFMFGWGDMMLYLTEVVLCARIARITSQFWSKIVGLCVFYVVVVGDGW